MQVVCNWLEQSDQSIQLICFEYFQALTSAAVAAETTRKSQGDIAVANEERDTRVGQQPTCWCGGAS